MVQKLRFENGEYDTLTRVMPTEETVITCSYSDPNVKTSFEILESMGNEIANIYKYLPRRSWMTIYSVPTLLLRILWD